MTPFRKAVLSMIALVLFSTCASWAHELGEAGRPVCLEGNFMVADAMNAPFANIPGGGRVLEMNIFTGARGITVNNPFMTPGSHAVLADDLIIPGPWKPTGVLSGGLNGHAFISGAAQHSFTEFHRDGTPIKSVRLPTAPPAAAGFGAVPRLLGSQMMPNGNIIQSVCDANFFNAPNSDRIAPGEPDPGQDGNAAQLYFPPVYSTPERARNSRLVVLDQHTLQVVDEYSAPNDPRWTCMAGVIFRDDGMYVSMFHGAAVFVIDWKAGIDRGSCGLGCNKVSRRGHYSSRDDKPHSRGFRFGQRKNKAKVIRVIDLLEDGDPNTPAPALDDPHRRDSLRAITFDESGNLYATFRARSRDCLRGEYPGAEHGCNPAVFRQHVAMVPAGADHPTRSIALDPGVNVIAGIRTNRISGPGCLAINPGLADPDACDVETLLVAASAFNPGCSRKTDQSANPCFIAGGAVGEYLLRADRLDATDGSCSGDPNGDNSGCAQPIASFTFQDDFGNTETIDPRMLMIIHEAFVQ